ncbi:MAG: polysaccharide deacetylase family protein [Acidobacteria bacterium]|nr:polysaccharide deacetylase family protein [Acidobacteriota bacterium]
MIKKAALELMTAAGVFAPFRWFAKTDTLILMYHRFGRTDDGVTVTPEVFSRQVAYLNAHYRIVPLSVVADYLKSGETLPRGLAVITVDDGYRDFYDAAFPILRKQGVTATVFLVTDFVSQKAWMPADRAVFLATQAAGGEYLIEIGGERIRLTLGDESSRGSAAARINSSLLLVPLDERNDAIARIAGNLGVRLPTLPPNEFKALDWNSAREMAMAGIEFGSHTVTHEMLTTVIEDRLQREVNDSRAQIEDELGRPSDLFSYPNGEMNDSVREAVIRAGYRGAGCSETGFNHSKVDRFAMRRIYADTDLPHFVQTTSGCEQFKYRLRNRGRG